MPILPVTQPSSKVYWIIVSDEGTSTKPRKHESYDSAYHESVRLSKLKPGINFTVLCSVGNTFTEKPVETKTQHELFAQNSYWYSYPGTRYWGKPKYPTF